ncbi:MAG TPA: hypothetical protein VMT27_03455 [Actinomycetes bacterium]|nr:hypothetical protein [Actinomycetes bacterium]
MSVASIDYTIDETAVEGHERDDVVDDWHDRKASLRRPFTRYEPRHRAAGPAA